ncbi:hypothetical protein [Maribacter litoralis]|uniref:hypothetical protein n=1 Tax=Maribacter litoralis TaxID=2059726 RepID=UPI003D2C8021
MILSHRGFWLDNSKKNSVDSFRRSFALGFGTETDIRDYKGKLVISHDIPDSKSLLLTDFFSIYSEYSLSLPLALNIKSDGLQSYLNKLIMEYNISNYFVFDMSIPDTIGYIKNELKVFTRQSEYEKTPCFYDDSIGVWLDEFESHWISRETIAKHLLNNKQVCIVSPELHKRPISSEWEDYKTIANIFLDENIHICTDIPLKAKEFFNG